MKLVTFAGPPSSGKTSAAIRTAEWGLAGGLDFLFTESAGLCNRCSPHIHGVFSLCVIDCLSGTNTPKKIGPMLRCADLVVVTKGDIVSQAEREVFAYRASEANKQARVIFVNGLTGQGSFELARLLKNAPDTGTLEHEKVRFPLPSALCSYCFGETRIGSEYQTGSVIARKMSIPGIGTETP